MEIDPRFVSFLKKELRLSARSIISAWKHAEHIPSLLPIIFWQDGSFALTQLERISDWESQFDLGGNI